LIVFFISRASVFTDCTSSIFSLVFLPTAANVSQQPS
jgi:hypothetical protein